ncbi:ABC transporter permease [Undibacterium pigrum]|uniref:Putative ABC transport system permease protein n=1 Tax=Undibacterium pigrum TaxID=401470 RepID=A0A318JB71_9BURK|nr:FtsX-like permease family protein [Undibacterium pigrum]PXX45348.1 putative ABC transport system permease protein [Undibacterium pigrum]
MFFHILKPIWKRKFKNLLLSLEILLAFCVLFGLALMSARYFQLYHMPRGFEYQDVWSVSMLSAGEEDKKNNPAVTENFQRSLAAMPEVEQVGFINFSPYSNATWRTDLYLPDSKTSYPANMIDMADEIPALLKMKLLYGRWFSAEDEGKSEKPILLNKRMAETMFPGKSAVGQLIADDEPGAKTNQMFRVTGVFEDFRNKGEFMAPTNFAIMRFSRLSAEKRMDVALLKVKPGTSRAFEEKLNQQLKLIRSDWGYRISPLKDMRQSKMAQDTIPLVILAIIAVFLLIMVGFGLFGVLWQNTTQRIPEIGLRRAIGAHSGHIYKQIISEQLLLSSIAMLVGIALLIQLPLTGVMGEAINWTVFLTALGISMFAIYGMSILCSLYPAWRASRLSPTEALHYE